MTDETEEVEEEGEVEDEADEGYCEPPLSVTLVEGDVSIPDADLMAEALERFGVVALGWRNKDGDLECLLASEAGFKWADICSLGRRGNVRPLQ